MTRSYVNTAIHNGGDLIPKVRTNEQYDGFWLDVIADRHEVTFHCQSLHGLREFAQQLNSEIDEQERRLWAAERDAASRVNPVAEQIEATGPRLSPEDAAEILAATDLNTWTTTEATHSELPDHLKPKREPIWQKFEEGFVPDAEHWTPEMMMAYNRWKLAGGKVKDLSADIPF